MKSLALKSALSAVLLWILAGLIIVLVPLLTSPSFAYWSFLQVSMLAVGFLISFIIIMLGLYTIWFGDIL